MEEEIIVPSRKTIAQVIDIQKQIVSKDPDVISGKEKASGYPLSDSYVEDEYGISGPDRDS